MSASRFDSEKVRGIATSWISRPGCARPSAASAAARGNRCRSRPARRPARCRTGPGRRRRSRWRRRAPASPCSRPWRAAARRARSARTLRAALEQLGLQRVSRGPRSPRRPWRGPPRAGAPRPSGGRRVRRPGRSAGRPSRRRLIGNSRLRIVSIIVVFPQSLPHFPDSRADLAMIDRPRDIETSRGRSAHARGSDISSAASRSQARRAGSADVFQPMTGEVIAQASRSPCRAELRRRSRTPRRRSRPGRPPTRSAGPA